MASRRPHSKLNQARSALCRERIARQLTIETLAQLAELSTSQAHRLERFGAGSPAAWRAMATALGVTPEAICPKHGPARGRESDVRQLELAGLS